MINYKSKVELKDYRRLVLYLTYRNPIVMIFSILALLSLLSSIIYVTDPKNSNYVGVVISFIFAFSVLILMPLLIILRINKYYSTCKFLQETVEYIIDENSITLKGETFSADYKWNNFYQSNEIEDWLFLYNSNRSAFLFSKRVIGEENLKNLKLLIKEKNIKNNFNNLYLS